MNLTHREAGCPELSGEALERHLFVCEACRDDARMASAWKALAESPEGAEARVSEAFLSRLSAARRRDGATALYRSAASTAHSPSSRP